jgi:hypothetical protein
MIATIGRVQNGTNWYNVPRGQGGAGGTNQSYPRTLRVGEPFLYRQAAGGSDTKSKKYVVFVFFKA